MNRTVFLPCWLFRVRSPALEPAGNWVKLGLGVEMNTVMESFCCFGTSDAEINIC